jgi:hypothetical protein
MIIYLILKIALIKTYLLIKHYYTLNMKRTKINFEILNKGKYDIIPNDKINESNLRIKENMKKFIKGLK